MIRFFVLVGLAVGVLFAYLTTVAVGPVAQDPPSESLLVKYREDGLLPTSPSLAEDHGAEDMGVFEVPERDGTELEMALAGAMDMEGMDMSGMDMAADDGAMDMEGMDMEGMDMAADDGAMDMEGMDMADDDGAMDMEGMDMAADDDGAMDMAADEDGAMDMEDMDMEGMDMAAMDMSDAEPEAVHAPEPGEGGLAFFDEGAFDKEVSLDMLEWGYSEMVVDAVMGERIKFTVTNTGEIPHEFMFMTMAQMNAVGYRITRADWSLLEHGSLFEQALVLPGGEFTFIVEVQQTGSWMFMCMLPYHMQMGMMGQMATEGMVMNMNMDM